MTAPTKSPEQRANAVGADESRFGYARDHHTSGPRHSQTSPLGHAELAMLRARGDLAAFVAAAWCFLSEAAAAGYGAGCAHLTAAPAIVLRHGRRAGFRLGRAYVEGMALAAHLEAKARYYATGHGGGGRA